jgi:formylglycine-generating enzyme required for sulfatase activity
MSRFGALGAWACCVAAQVACAGSSFELADDAAQSQGGSGFPQLETTDHMAQAGASGASGADGGTPAGGAAGTSSEPEPAGPIPSACGDLRNGPTGEDKEVCIEGGAFTMGNSTVTVPSGYTAHGPAHEVTLSAYVLDTFEVSVSRYRACVTAGTCRAPLASPDQGCTFSTASTSNDRLPVTCVSYDDAVAFCNWDGGRRLPTEAEWERATRGTAGTTYAWGNDVSCSKAIFGALAQCPQYVGVMPREIGSAPLGASPEGARDLTGNAWEWVNDWFGVYSSAAVSDPTGPDNGSARIQRGGNWQTPPSSAQGFMRRAEAPAAIGPSSFRCARGPLTFGTAEL